jgi:hypothetical protein
MTLISILISILISDSNMIIFQVSSNFSLNQEKKSNNIYQIVPEIIFILKCCFYLKMKNQWILEKS